MADKHRIELGDTLTIAKAALDDILAALGTAGYQLVGPRLEGNAILYADLEDSSQLPRGCSTEQGPGLFRIRQAGNGRFFDFIPGAASWKQFLFPPREELWSLHKDGKQWKPNGAQDAPKAQAFIGVRPCELAAIQIHDRIFLREDYSDATYSQRRSKVFILAVNCLHPAGTCFCSTMGTGPEAQSGFDLSLTELDDRFLIRVGSALGSEIMQGISAEPASAFHLGAAARALDEAATKATCGISPQTCAEDVMTNLEHPNWEEVAKRCLSCGNCTLACPTCFCWDVLDQTNLAGTETRRERVWDSCFNLSYSYQAGGNIRPTIKSRYRQWLSHKFGSWKEQHGSLGCVGCGRCITWCPAGIDTRVEVAALQKETTR